jgi:hypothetical protein
VIGTRDPLDQIRPASGDCEGVAFLSYTFDARFFEEEVLATLLPIRSDPLDQFRNFTNEGRLGLQKTPVVVMVDSGHFRGRRRLPYDLLLAPRERTFHPKLGLALFRDHARLWIGSGNLTESGYGGNAELFCFQKLDYQQDSSLLYDTADFLSNCGMHGEAWNSFRDVLNKLLPERTTQPADPALLVGGQAEPLLEKILARIPHGARVHSIGVLAPFHQEDGARAESSVLERMLDGLGKRCAKTVKLDIGLSWEGNPVAPPAETEPPSLHSSKGRLFGWTERGDGGPTVSWFRLGAHEGYSFRCQVGAEEVLRSSRALNQALSNGKAWLVDRVVAPGPASLIGRAAKRSQLHLWVHPEVHRVDGRAYRQPLHAKLVAIATTEDRTKRTHLFVGSANASARALLVPHGNVECMLHLTIDGHHRLADLCPGLVSCPIDRVELVEREFPELETNPAVWVDDACYDASSETLRVTWLPDAPPLRLLYPREGASQPLFEGKPSAELSVADFELHPSCSDLAVVIAGQEGRVPIRIENIHDLPTGGLSGALTLDELILLHSGRFTLEGLESHRQLSTAGLADDSAEVSGLLSLGLQPREFFRAFSGLANDLADEGHSLRSFFVLLDGRAGIRILAQELIEAPTKGLLTDEEAWIYGKELARALEGEVRFSPDPLGKEKALVLRQFLDDLHDDLADLQPDGPSARAIARFYRTAP